MKDQDYTVIDGNLEIIAHKQVVIQLDEDVRYENITVNNRASLKFIGDYNVYVTGEIIYDKIKMSPSPNNPDIHIVEFVGEVDNIK